MKQLLVDYVDFQISPQMIIESMNANNGKVIVHGILQRAEAKNHNGRIYPKPILERESKKYKEIYIGQNRAMGELDHPDSSVVNLKNVSHNILDVWWTGNDLMGKIEILTTPAGNILRELLKSGIRLGISSRGLGSVAPIKEDDGVEGDSVMVQDDFSLIAWDFVSSPSTQGAFMKPMNEGVNPLQVQIDQYAKISNLIQDILQQ